MVSPEELTCPAPLDVPPNLAAPSRGYRRRVALAFAALLSFIAVYVALTGWFIWSAYRIAAGASSSNNGGAFLVVLPLAFLGLFMLKALFFRDKADTAREIEIDAASEPRLYAFLLRIADQAGAPRPHRVFLSGRVNAGVSYDFSILNLIFPSKKNLDIGLGLINALTLGEVRAVLAHEFGHFAQGAMAVGRWVFVAQRVAAHIVHKRDIFDRFLRGVSAFDLRVAWVGWIMRLVIWALRAVLDTVFSVVVRAQRALDHEMERQADLVAVTLTGSDALVNALHKLGAADMAWDRAVGIAAGRHAKGELVDDLFAMQSRVIEHDRRVLADETHGVAPPLPAQGRAQHRLFEERIAVPPRMWSSHPPNREREDNVKRTYVPCELDDRSAWLLFADADATRARATEATLAALPAPAGTTRKLTREESLRAVDESFDRAFLDPRYRGAYLGRSAVRGAKAPADLYLPPERAREIPLEQLYPEGLRGALEKWKSLESEFHVLQGLQRGFLQSGGADIKFRGEVLRRRELEPKLEAVGAERAAARAELEERDREHRSAHLAAAERIGQGWPEYLRSLAALLHYADHTEADLRDARGSLANVVAVATADGRVSSSERRQIAVAGVDVHCAMEAIWDQRGKVHLPADVVANFGVETWAQALPDDFKLGLPSEQRIGDWLEVIDSWLDAFIRPLDVLERCALEALLRAEAKVAAFAREPSAVTPAPPPAATPAKYATLMPGAERKRQWRLGWWDRFQTADGFVASLARFAVAGAMVTGMILLGMSVGDSKLVVYNGLGRAVVVHVGEEKYELNPFSKAYFNELSGRRVHVAAETTAGEPIEEFDAPLGRSFQRYVYNVAGAAPLVRWVAVYGGADTSPDRALGAPRWSATDATVLFERPPEHVSTKRGRGTTMPVLMALADGPSHRVLATLREPEERARVIREHALWDEAERPHTSDWMHQAMALPDFPAIVKARLARSPHDISAMRAEQDQPDAAAKAEACARHTQLAAAAPDDGDLAYLALRCQPHGRARDEATLAARKRAPFNAWLGLAAGYVHARRSEWNDTLQCWATARQSGALEDQMLIHSARVMRLAGSDFDAQLPVLARQSEELRAYLALEDDRDTTGGSGAPYLKLVSGALGEAAVAAGDDAGTRARVVRLVAASRGATAEQIAAAAALPADAGIDYDTIWPAIGLALRNKQDAAALVARMKDFAPADSVAGLEQFLHPERLVKDRKAAQAALSALDPIERGHAYVLGAVILGDAAPDDWRRGARALLFAPERPFL
ncbi:MAG TPA: M48 family metalloprotease [Polyangia bacterium]|jgi:Zn-dependent protease with chaperone function